MEDNCGHLSLEKSVMSSSELLSRMWIMEKTSPLVTPRSEGVTVCISKESVRLQHGNSDRSHPSAHLIECQTIQCCRCL
jgi:hypothetical protein